MSIKTLRLTNYWHEQSGGIATICRQLMQAANRHQHGMILLVPGAQDEVQEFLSSYLCSPQLLETIGLT